MMAETSNKPNSAPPLSSSSAAPGASRGDGIQLNVQYFKTVPGILKIVHLGLGILCMALGSPAFWSNHHFFLFVAVSGFILSMVWTIIYLLSLRTALNIPINWTLSELLFLAGTTLMYLIASIAELANPGAGSYVAAGIFGLFITGAYGGAAYLMYTEWNGGVTVVTTTTGAGV